MSRRVVAISLVAAVVVGAGVFLLWPSPPGSRITRSNFEKIQEGMTEAEVNALLDAPPGEYWSQPGFYLVGHGHIPRTERARGGKLRVWYCDDFMVEVLYDKDGRVIGKYWYDPDEWRGT